jgi:alkanesulfonate monooxygenase SsuD/methylene tetrahydromethanopterin reductase-like flavin-dependent oxidoreductase (luciferase family)
MTEFVTALRAIWRCWNEGEPLDFHGRFYRHDLMTPAFGPGPSGAGEPRVLLAAVGPRMTAAACAVADGIIAHPLTSRRVVGTQADRVLRLDPRLPRGARIPRGR